MTSAPQTEVAMSATALTAVKQDLRPPHRHHGKHTMTALR